MCMRASEGAGKREKSTRYSRMSECNVHSFYLNILTPLNYKTDSFKQNTDCAGGDAQSLGWCHILDIFTTCLLEEKANAFIPPNRKATNLELTELRSYVWTVQRWVITD